MLNLDSGGAGVRLTAALFRSIFPGATSSIIDAFVEKQGALSAVGVNQTRRKPWAFRRLRTQFRTSS
jgi:hypothetical protein